MREQCCGNGLTACQWPLDGLDELNVLAVGGDRVARVGCDSVEADTAADGVGRTVGADDAVVAGAPISTSLPAPPS